MDTTVPHSPPPHSSGLSRHRAGGDGGHNWAANPFEPVVRAVALDVPGLTVEPQGEVPGVGWVDLLDHRLGLVVEADSFQHHGTLAGLRRDVRRYTDLTRRGLTVVRFLWEEAMFDQPRVHAVLVDAVAQCAAVRRALGPIDLWDPRWRGQSCGSWELDNSRPRSADPRAG